jgi:hypothetical protein
MSQISPMRRGAIEAVAIVGSILLAFAIDAAWEARGERAVAADILTALEAEFSAEHSELVRHRDRWVEVRAATEQLIEATSVDVVPPPAVMDTLLFRFLTPTTWDPQMGTLSATMASGQIGLLGSVRLRTQLAAWEGIVAEVRDNELAMRDFSLSGVVPFLAREGVSLARSRSMLSDAWPGVLPADDEVRPGYAALIANAEFETLVGTRYGWINVWEYDQAIAFVEDILEMIRELS